MKLNILMKSPKSKMQINVNYTTDYRLTLIETTLLLTL